MGADVMAVDKNEEIVASISEKVTQAIIADVSNPEAVKGLGLSEVDMTGSIMAVMVAKEQNVPYVLAKASDERMGQILRRIGADKIIYPEEETGLRTARIMLSDSFLEFFEIDDNLCLLEIKPKKEWIGKNLIELNLREQYHVNVVAIKDQSKMHSSIDPQRPLEKDTTLLVILEKKDLNLLK